MDEQDLVAVVQVGKQLSACIFFVFYTLNPNELLQICDQGSIPNPGYLSRQQNLISVQPRSFSRCLYNVYGCMTIF